MRQRPSLLGCATFLLLAGCTAGLGPATRSLTPTSKGERLTPTSKGERLRDGRLSGRLAFAETASVPTVANALVRIEGTDLQTHADAEGRFVLLNAPVAQAFILTAEKTDAEGQSFKASVNGLIPASSKSLDLASLLLKATGGVSGQIGLADGKPPEAIDVYIAGTSLAAKTDAEGNYALSDLPEGSYRLTAYKAGYALAQSEPLTIRAGKIQLAPDLELSPESTASKGFVSGRVSAGGQSVAGAFVALVGDDLTQSRLALTDATGAYSLPLPAQLPAGGLALVVSKPFYQTIVADVTAASAGDVLQPEISLSSATLTLGRLQVEVKDCADRPVASALIQLDPAPALGPPAFTDSQGQAHLSQLLPGHYTVYAAKGKQSTFTGILVDNLAVGPDQKPGALARARLVLGAPCPAERSQTN